MKCHSTEIYSALVSIDVHPTAFILIFSTLCFTLGWFKAWAVGGLSGSVATSLVGGCINDLNLLVVRQIVNLLNGQEILFVLCEFHIIVTLIFATGIALDVHILSFLGMFRHVLIRRSISILSVRLKDLLDDLSNLVFGLHCFRSLLLYPINTASFLVKLDQGFSSRVFDLKCFRCFSNGYTVLLGEFDEHSSRLSGDRIIMISLLGVAFVFWNFREHFTLDKLDFNFKLSIQNVRLEFKVQDNSQI